MAAIVERASGGGLRVRRDGRIVPVAPSFRDSVVDLFDAQFGRLYRFIDRLSGEPDLAADIAQETFVRLHARGSLPDEPEAWLVTVALNLFRNARSTRARRRALLTKARAEAALSDPPASPADVLVAPDTPEQVRAALEKLDCRERQLLLLRAEGYSYREIATALRLNEHSVGTLLARAKRAFRTAYGVPVEENVDA